MVTLYTYDTLDNLTCVEQHGTATGQTGCSAAPSNNPSSVWRIRRFTYDSLDPSFAKMRKGREVGRFPGVDNFVAEKASNFNKVQQSSTSRPQRLQQQSLRINKNP
jgi:hypothetical protein